MSSLPVDAIQDEEAPPTYLNDVGITKGEERAALSMAIKKHSHQLRKCNVDKFDVFEQEEDIINMSNRDFYNSGNQDISDNLNENQETLNQDAKSKSSRFFNSSKVKSGRKKRYKYIQAQRYYLDREARRIRLVLGILTIVAAIAIATVYGSGTLGKDLASFVSKQTLGIGEDSILSNSQYDYLENSNLILAPVLEVNFGDTSSPYQVNDTPFFWQIPKSGGNAVKKVMNRCYGFVEASEMGARYSNSATLQVLESGSGEKFVNVDTTTHKGLKRAKQLNLVESRLADVIVSTYIHETAGLFNPSNQAKVFALFRHPIDRAVGVYKASPAATKMDVEEYFTGGSYTENNLMTRLLANKAGGSLTQNDLDIAMQVLRRKFIVGLVDKFDESMYLYKKYFNWETRDSPGISRCISQISESIKDEVRIPQYSQVWNAILSQNQWDLKLFDYTQYLFEVQRKTLLK